MHGLSVHSVCVHIHRAMQFFFQLHLECMYTPKRDKLTVCVAATSAMFLNFFVFVNIYICVRKIISQYAVTKRARSIFCVVFLTFCLQ